MSDGTETDSTSNISDGAGHAGEAGAREPSVGERWYLSSGPPGAMRWLAEAFTRDLSAGASGLVRGLLRVRLTGLARGSRRDFVASVEDPTCSYVLAAGTPAPGSPLPAACLEFSPGLALGLVERLLGSSAASGGQVRPLTGVERSVLSHLAEAVALSLSAAWPVAARPAFRVRSAPVGPPGDGGDEQVIVATFELSYADCVGTMRLGVCAEAIGPALPSEAGGRSGSARLELSAGLEGITLEQADLDGLEEGDIIATDVATDGEVIVRVGGIPKFAARLGVTAERRFLTITRRLEETREA